MNEYMKKYWTLWAGVAFVVLIGLMVLTSFLVTNSIIGVKHANNGFFETKCELANGTAFESRQSGICYDKEGKILFSTGTGGFDGFRGKP